MIPRSDYMQGKVTHREYYAQFVTPMVLALVGNRWLYREVTP